MIEVVKVDATDFKKNVGDYVKKGELLGYIKTIPVYSNINGVIICIYFDDDNHELEVVISDEK